MPLRRSDRIVIVRIRINSYGNRLLVVAANSRNYGDVQTLDDLNQNHLHEIEHFFVSYTILQKI
ncbi:inorganic diphosphatase [Iningainema sp. BLCCT55]|uniref:inorganic diphosphatase n=1 Tax=Iningainema tapete BLCC-T55 TaxID=2748662 RepID=A0A8J6XKT0_9CYAN|nr:inorganic diphosphatase [Iningainema tapete BLCC-T55]